MRYLLSTFCCVLLLYGNLAAGSKEEKAVRQVVQEFLVGINKQVPAQVDALLLGEFRSYVLRPETVMTMTVQDILGALSAKKIGGEDREIMMHFMKVRSGMAAVGVETTGETGSFFWFLSLLHTENSWKIANAVATFEPLSD